MSAGNFLTFISGLIVVVVSIAWLNSGNSADVSVSSTPAPIKTVVRISPRYPTEEPKAFIEVERQELPEHLLPPSTPVPAPTSEIVWSPVPPQATASVPPVPQQEIILPVIGEISQNFGCSSYYTGVLGPGCSADAPWFHDGLDIRATVGTPVKALIAGTVIFAGPDPNGPVCGNDKGYGLGVVIDNGDGWRALYAHLSRIDVVVGQTTTPETVIGATGETGCVTGPHLHFGLQYNETLVDPKLVMIRVLP